MGTSKIKVFYWIAHVIVVLGLCGGCSSTKNISKEFPYNQCIGKQFILKEDMYIFQDHDSSEYSIAGPNSGITGLPPLVNKNYLTNLYYTKNNTYLFIDGIIQKGSVFSIIKVNYVKTFELSYVDFLISFSNNSVVTHELLSGDICNLDNPPFTKTWSDPPIFKANLVEPLPSDGVWWK